VGRVLGLIDGLPINYENKVWVYNHQPEIYSWDSEFGVPEFRHHATEMLKVIFEESPNAKVKVFPFFPKYSSAYKNYKLLADSIHKAIDFNCNLICLCIEALDRSSLSLEVIKAYERAKKNKIIICVSAGNSNLMKNPLIHKEYTIPIIGLEEKNNRNYKANYAVDFLNINTNPKMLNEHGDRVNCSRATAHYASILSKEKQLKGSSDDFNNVVKITYGS